jgi:hypothetical protein
MVVPLISPGGEAHVFAPRRAAGEMLERIRGRFTDVADVSVIKPEWHPGVIIRMVRKAEAPGG